MHGWGQGHQTQRGWAERVVPTYFLRPRAPSRRRTRVGSLQKAGARLRSAGGSRRKQGREGEERRQESLLQNRNPRLEIQRRAKKGRRERLQDETERERNNYQGSPGNVGHSDKVPSWPDIRHPQFGSTGYWCPPSVLMWVPMLSQPLSTLAGTPILGKGGEGGGAG